MTKDEQTIANLKKLKSVHNGSYGVDIDRAIKAIEQQSKTGHWTLVQCGKRVDLCCDNCGAVRVEKIAYNYTIDQLNKFFKKDFKEVLKHPDMSYCPSCGAKMENENT